jgi:hypothetical protein
MTDPISKTMIKARGKMSKRELARMAADAQQRQSLNA